MLAPDSLVIAPPKPHETLQPRVSSTILLADDEAEIRALAGAVLREHGYEVLEAEDGLAALIVAARHHGPIHLLLTDWNMPRLDGAGLIRSLAAAHPETAVIVASGGLDSDVPPTAAILPKPFTLDNLVSKVRDVLESQPARLGNRIERRRKMRYPIEVNVYYRAIEHKHGIYRAGQTTNLSSGGVRVVTPQEHHLRTGTKLEIKIEWTCPLNGTVPLNLVAIGTVARREQFGFAATFERHEFRIARQPLQCSLMRSA